MKNGKKYRSLLGILPALAVVGLLGGALIQSSGSTSWKSFLGLPGQDSDREGSASDTETVAVVPRKSVYAGGTPIGIYLETDGVFVVDTGKITDADGNACCPAENIVKSGDYIQAVNGEAVSTKEELVSCIGKSGGEDLTLDVNRDGKEISLRIHPVQDENGTYRAGIWVRNDTQGIGTLTYLEADGSFGALGHGISDVDTGEILEVKGGTLYDADVISVIKGQQGAPGELAGIIHYSEGYKIGKIENNCSNGIFGTVTNLPALVQDRQLYEIAYKQEVETGSATILCTVDGTCREYGIEILEVRRNGKDENKSMILEVTDPKLLEKTGGIVQGMSGSPILQNGRIVGAVTHVFVNDPTKGYGIFIENMLET
jgi:stage IV sporulation protein B